MSREEVDKTIKVSLPDAAHASVVLREAMSVEEFLASACARKGLAPMEHFVRVKKRRDMEDHNYFVPHRSDLIETYVSHFKHGVIYKVTKGDNGNKCDKKNIPQHIMTFFKG